MDRLEKLESIVNRIVRRVRSTTSTIVTPHLISVHKGEKIYGILMSRILFKGKITKALICFDKKPTNTICVEVKILSNEEGFTKSYYIDTIRASVDLSLDTIDGSIISVSIKETNGEEDISQVWLSILWQPSLSNTEIKNYLIDSLDKASEEFLIEE